METYDEYVEKKLIEAKRLALDTKNSRPVEELFKEMDDWIKQCSKQAATGKDHPN